jgi:mersacidin/lichenicidin family type 2 lantibiotic
MTSQSIIRAWKDEDYRLNLSEAERANLPQHPAGLTELTEPEMDSAGGRNAFDTLHILTLGCCPTGYPPCPPVGTEMLMTLGCCPDNPIIM